MYCIKCGVELSEGQKKCPLCDTMVNHLYITFPDVPGAYPNSKKEGDKLKPNGLLLITSMVFVLTYLLLLFIDIQAHQSITWSGYASNAILLLYVLIVLPFWFKKRNPVFVIPVNLAAIGFYLMYINYETSGDWFFKFALPIIVLLTFIMTATAGLIRYLHRGYLFIASGVCFSMGGFIMILEALINDSFGISNTLIWAPYPFITCCLIGIVLIVIAVHRPLREYLHKYFFI
jgi:hypothetical protein